MFDPIAYEKTAGVLSMIEAYVGPEAFRKGVSSYLTKYSLRQRRRRGLLDRDDARHRASRSNRIMKSFVDQPGAPLLSVRTRCVGRQHRA